MHQRSEVAHIYRDFTSVVQTQFGNKIKVFCSDSTHEYLSSSFVAFFLLKEPFLNSHALTHISKMVLLRGSIAIFLRPLVLFLSLALGRELIGQRKCSLLSYFLS